jgi:hypothetical protein
MKNKKLLYGLLGVGAIAGLYFWNKNKKSTNGNLVVSEEPKQKVALSDKEKIALFEKAINSWKGGVAPPPQWEENNRKAKELANAQIKELKLETEFSTWLNARPKVDYGMYLPA